MCYIEVQHIASIVVVVVVVAIAVKIRTVVSWPIGFTSITNAYLRQ